jgi:hypothetical protein
MSNRIGPFGYIKDKLLLQSKPTHGDCTATDLNFLRAV